MHEWEAGWYQADPYKCHTCADLEDAADQIVHGDTKGYRLAFYTKDNGQVDTHRGVAYD